MKFFLIHFSIFILFNNCTRDFLPLEVYPLTNNIQYKFNENVIQSNWLNIKDLKLKNRNNQNSLIYKIKLPAMQYKEPALFIPNIFESFEVLLEKNVIYKSGNITNDHHDDRPWIKTPSSSVGNASPGVQWHIVPLTTPSRESSVIGKTIYIKVQSNNSFLIGFSSPPYYGNKHSLITMVIVKDFGIFFSGLVGLIISMVAILGYLVVKDIIFLYFAIFNALFGIYFINLSDISQLIYYNPNLRIIIWEISVISAAISFSSYFSSLLKKTSILMKWQYTFIGFIFFKYSIYGLQAFNESTVILNFFIIIGLAIMTYIAFVMAFKKNLEASVLSINLFLISILALYDAFFINFQNRDQSVLHYAYFSFIVTNGYISINKHYARINRTKIKYLETELNKKNLAEFKFQQLTEKMSPHFLFNTLNLIHSYIFTNPENAKKALLYLHENFRYIIDYTKEQKVILQKEWEFTENYLHLLKMRFRKKVTFKMHISDKIKNLPIPPLSIQPFVENSYKHGIRNSSRKGIIEATASKLKDGAIITIIDNGIGLIQSDISIDNPNRLHSIIRSKTRDNVLDRFKFYYNTVQIQIKNREDKKGVIVKIIFKGRKRA